MRKTAQQFYYDVIAPEESGMNYAQAHYRRLEDNRVRDWVRQFLAPHQSDKDFDDIAEHARSFVPTYSNDFLLDHIVGELIEHSEGEIQEYLKKLFVAKRHDPLENAGARPNSGDYDGDLILFHVGLSLACHEYANLFAKSVAHKFDNEVRRQPREQRDAKLVAEAEKLFAAQTKWHANGDRVRLELQTITSDHPRGAIIAHMTDRFILCHEVAHLCCVRSYVALRGQIVWIEAAVAFETHITFVSFRSRCELKGQTARFSQKWMRMHTRVDANDFGFYGRRCEQFR